MRNFGGYVSNGEFSVGCTGRTVYIYDKDNNELGQFKDITYGYKPLISPDGKMVAVKSTEGRFAVYSLETVSLIKKFRFSKVDGAQDDNFCFSPDSKFLINLERQIDSLHSAISVYDTIDFSLVNQIILSRDMMLSNIEYDEESASYYVLGFERGADRCASKFFVAQLVDLQIVNITYIPEEENWSYRYNKSLKISGFTKKANEFSRSNYALEDLKPKKRSLAELYNRYNKTSE